MRPVHRVHILLLLLLLFCPLPSALAGINLTTEERAFLDSHGPVVFVSQSHYPPFEFTHADGSRDGMTIELATWLATEIGFRARFIDMSFAEAQQAIQSEQADVLTSFFYSELRDQTFDFTTTLFEVPASIFVAAERPDIVQLRDLNGKRIAMQQGDYAKNFLVSAGISFEKVATRDFSEATAAVIDGRADALIGDEQIVQYYLYSNHLTERIKKVGDPLYVGLNSMAVKEGNELLLSLLNKGIAFAQDSGVIDRLNQKWIGVHYQMPHKIWPRIWPYLVVAVAMLLVVITWNVRLRQVVGQKTSALSASEARYRELYEELKIREERLNYSLAGANCGLWDWGIVDQRMYYDPNYYRMAGYEPDAFPATYEEWKKRVHPDDVVAAERSLNDCISGKTINYTSEFRFLTATGEWLWIMDKGDVVERTNDGKALRFIGLHVDISERVAAEQQRHELEAQLRQKYKVEAIGLMAGGMAHNFNNNLAIILGSVELAQRRSDSEQKVIPLLENIRTAALRSRDLVQQVLVYSRMGVINKKQINPAEVVKETVKLLQLTIPATVQIQCQIEPDATELHVSGDGTQIQEALINLCNNAVFAMEEKGALKIRVGHAQLSADHLPPQVELSEIGFVHITVEDSGCGIAPELQDKIFDPFFTTKEVNAGTGMGLSTVQGVMDQHKGFIKLVSTPGQGAVFSLFFPVVKGADSPVSAVDGEPIEGDERILFVDDDAMVAEVGRQMLEQAGYRVTIAEGGVQALKMLADDPQQFDLVITDQTMPELSGEELIARLLEMRADLPVILCTGYSNRIDAEGAKALGARAFLLKPLKMLELLVRVRQVLDS
jgi:signal transduction histidine kinase/ABC-type amino acid transport substrate-binding protein/BarA-like signal transduction histidine kinase